MITLEELKRDKEALEEKFRLYEEQQKELVSNSYELEIPEKDEHFYFRLLSDGSIAHESFELNFDIRTFKQGNYFLEESEAKLESKRRKLITRFNQFRGKCNGNWKPELNDRPEKKYFIRYYNTRKDFNTACIEDTYNFSMFGYFKNEQDCQRAIEIFGDEIKELF